MPAEWCTSMCHRTSSSSCSPPARNDITKASWGRRWASWSH
jgi:hypothetical protein